MATLHKEFIAYDKDIKLNENRKTDLQKSKKDIRRKIKKWFAENKSEELQPKFKGQGSFEMDTCINPIPEYDSEGNKLLKYDLDYGVYFIEKENEDNKKSINTWHDWIYESVENHTNKKPIRKTTCVRVVFSNGRHIDLPIYYKNSDIPQLAHKSKDWIDSDPKEFIDWFNNNKKNQLVKIIRCLKGWKNHKEYKNPNLKLPSGFELTILAINNYVEDDFLDVAFRKTIKKINDNLNSYNGFKCLRPTTPNGEDLFENYSETRKSNFLNSLNTLLEDCEKANDEKNFLKASEILIKNQFGERFPKGENKSEESKSYDLKKSIGSAIVKPKPYGS
ncbi:MAG: hypothetical protein JXK08_03325 [Flavobacteriaceae bacterium]|nr:hypothetical protein [Flavobacteriaceae bacterium]